MRLDPDHSLAPATVRSLKDLFGNQLGASADVSDQTLASFVADMVTADEREEVLAELVRSPSVRGRLVEISRRWSSRSLQSPEIETALRRAFEVYGDLGERSHAEEWTRIRDAQGAEPASLRAAMLAIGRSIRLMLSVPQYALARGGSDGLVREGYVPAGVSLEFFAEIRDDGSLHADVSFAEQFPGAARPLAGRRLQLELLDPSGGGIIIDHAESTLQGCGFIAAEFQRLTGLPHGSLPGSLFRVTVDDAITLPRSRNHLFVDSGQGEALAFQIVDEPRIADGTLTLTLSAPADVRRRYRDFQLQISVPIGTAAVSVGSWPMSDWIDDVRTLRAPLPGIAEGRIECGSLVQGHLVKIIEGE